MFCWLLAAGCWLLLCVTGCVRRELTIRSDPPGATLLVNDKDLGTTPHTYDFEWYGWYRITLMKDGYERLDDRPLIESPWYLWIPLDLAMELMPFEVRDEQELSYELVPVTPWSDPRPPDFPELDEMEQQYREQLEPGAAEEPQPEPQEPVTP